MSASGTLILHLTLVFWYFLLSFVIFDWELGHFAHYI